jgi:ubiquinone/menaquinone biosynthesis C-methylase UbiE
VDKGASRSEYYEEFYSDVQRKGIQGWGNSLGDKSLERYWRCPTPKSVLEVGSSAGQHLPWSASRQHERYVCLDLDPLASRLSPQQSAFLSSFRNLHFVAGDAHRLPFADESFDRVVSTCLLHHLSDAEQALFEIRRVLRPGGEFGVEMPTDPGVLNRIVKAAITYPSMKRLGVTNPRLTYAREHRNQIGGLIVLLREVFKGDDFTVRYHPFRVPTWNLNLFVTFHVRRGH